MDHHINNVKMFNKLEEKCKEQQCKINSKNLVGMGVEINNKMDNIRFKKLPKGQIRVRSQKTLDQNILSPIEEDITSRWKLS